MKGPLVPCFEVFVVLKSLLKSSITGANEFDTVPFTMKGPLVPCFEVFVVLKSLLTDAYESDTVLL